MQNKTPLRLVALEEGAAADEDDELTLVQEFPAEDEATSPDGTPVKSTPEHEAITRRVPAAPDPAAQTPEWPKPSRTWRRFLPALVALVPILVVLVTWLSSRPAQPTASQTAAAAFAAKQPQATPAPARHPVPVPAPAPAPQGKANPEVIRLQVTAEPVEAELSLDGNVLAGHRLNLEVPKDRGIHVVSASAPGYFPFNQQVSFASDVVLQINLRRAHASGVRQVSRSRPSRTEVRTQPAAKAVVAAPLPTLPPVEVKPQNTGVLPSARPTPRLEPGMDLEAPTARRGAKSIDERNPYKP